MNSVSMHAVEDQLNFIWMDDTRLGLAPIKGPCHSSTERSPEVFCCPVMVFWRKHDELFNRFPEEFKNSKSFPSGPFYFRFVLPDSLF